MPIPTRTSVSRQALPLITRSSSHSTVLGSKTTTIVEPPGRELRFGSRNWKVIISLTESKVAEFVTSLDFLSLHNGGLDTTNHHSSDTDTHHSAELRAVDGNNLSSVLTIDIQRSSNSLWLNKELLSITYYGRFTRETYIDGVVFTRNEGHRTDLTIDG